MNIFLKYYNNTIYVNRSKMLGIVIREKRIARGLTQKKLSEACSFSQSKYCRIEQGETDINMRTLYDIAVLLLIKPYKLMAEAEKLLSNIKLMKGK